MSKSGWADLDITKDELDRFSTAFKSSEFKKLFAEYCQELNDPENRRLFEKELTELEAERGIKVTFINPEPGYVIKTSVNGDQKAFINVAKCDKVSQPTSASGENESGQRGLHWNIPYTQSPARCDIDHSGAVCPVYDVVFHSHTLHLASKNGQFRKLVTKTACEAVQRTHGVDVDMANLKFPKMTYKGTPKPTIIRERNGKVVDLEPSPIDDIYPPLRDDAATLKEAKKTHTKGNNKNVSSDATSKYATPKFQIVHRRDIELHEMTDELDAKINLTIPKELVVTIDLPLLKSTKDVALDVTARTIHLISEVPAKYKLKIDLPFEVDESNGMAKFDSSNRKLEITLPVVRRKKLTIVDLCREDSGVESDHNSPKEDSSSSGSSDENYHANDESDDVFEDALSVLPANKIVNGRDIYLNSLKNGTAAYTEPAAPEENTFLDSSILYTLPTFTYNRMKKTIALTLNAKNVSSDSIEMAYEKSAIQLKFSSIGAGHFPIHHAFYFNIPSEPGTIQDARAEAWDNNVIIQLDFNPLKSFESYHAGLSKQDYKEFPCPFTEKCGRPTAKDIEAKTTLNEAISVDVKSIAAEEIQIEITSSSPVTVETANNIAATVAASKGKNKKKSNKKNRSYSESHCEELLADIEEEHATKQATKLALGPSGAANDCIHLKLRSISESSNDEQHSCEPILKGILKRRSSYNRSASECSTDEQATGKYSCSIDLGVGSFSSIPEERGSEMSESVRKTVTFDKNLCRKLLFKMNSTIVGQRKPKTNRRKKKKHSTGDRERRYSEGEASDYETKPLEGPCDCNKKKMIGAIDENGGHGPRSKTNGKGNGRIVDKQQQAKEPDTDKTAHLEFKNGMMFDIEI